MPRFDFRQCRVSGASPRALDLYEAAIAELLRHRGEPLRLAREAAREAPGFVAARQLEAALLLCSRERSDFEAAGRLVPAIAALAQNDRERGHSAALAAAANGDYARAVECYDAVLAAEPRDAVALAAAQTFDHLLGRLEPMRERPARVAAAWGDIPGRHAVLSMLAFGLQECGEYQRAEEAARRALELEPLDVRAHHAVVHVLEMQGRFEEGVRWMGERARHWADAGAAATHNWWHLALYQIELGRADAALRLYDRHIGGGGALSERIDASSLLWRLELAGVDAGARWSELAGAWAPRAEDAHCAFNDLHAMMAFVGARRWDDALRLIAAQARRAEGPAGANRDMTRLVGLPACRALLAYGRGEPAAAERLLRALPPVAHRLGGSHAQRDVLFLTRAAAAAPQRRATPASPRRAPTPARGAWRAASPALAAS
jgi:tetratricopeptide (TPR) repeat protein